MFSFEHVEIRILQASSFPVSPGHVVSTLAKAITMPGVGVEGVCAAFLLCSASSIEAGGGKDLVSASPQHSARHPRDSLLN